MTRPMKTFFMDCRQNLPWCLNMVDTERSVTASSSLWLLFFSHQVTYNSLRPHGLQHARLPCPSPSPRVCSNSSPLSQQCHPTVPSCRPFSFHLQSFPASGSFPMNQLFASHGQIIGTSASASVLPVHIQGWFPLELTSLVFLQSKGLSRVFLLL